MQASSIGISSLRLAPLHDVEALGSKADFQYIAEMREAERRPSQRCRTGNDLLIHRLGVTTVTVPVPEH